MEICQYIVGKNKNALETGRKTIRLKAFPSCFAASAK
jgi:hypothetical protein